MRLLFFAITVSLYAGLRAQSFLPNQESTNITNIAPLYRYLNSVPGDVRACIWIKNGMVVTERYKEPFYKDALLPINSITKSVVSILTGIAIQRGYINSEQQLITELLPIKQISNPDPRWRKLTVQHLLTMKSGLTFSAMEKICPQCNTLEQVMEKVEFKGPPDKEFDYSEITAQLLILVLQHAVKMPIEKFAEATLFKTLDIKRYNWTKVLDVCTEGGLQLMANDVAKIGWLMTNAGNWNGEQIVSKEFWFHGTQATSEYGYMWWTKSDGSFWGIGNHGKYLFCARDRNSTLVVLSEVNGEQAGEIADSVYQKFMASSDLENSPTFRDTALVPDTFPKVVLPDWIFPLIGEPIKRKTEGHTVSLLLGVDESQSLTLTLRHNDLFIDVHGGNGRSLLSQLQLCEGDSNSYNKEYLSTHMEPLENGVKFVAKGIVTNSEFVFFLTKRDKLFVLNALTDKEEVLFNLTFKIPR